MSFRASAGNRSGDLSRFRTAVPIVQHGNSDDDEDNDYDNDSEEEEGILSRQHGEAKEDNTKEDNHEKSKRKPTDEEIAAEYNKTAKKQKVSRRRHTISEMDLVQPHGLSAIFTNFPQLFQRQSYKKNRKDMAKFSRQLIQAYQQWSNKIVPGTPLEEVLWKINTLNSKTSVKRFLQTMRDQVRNQHVERIYGLEKAEQMIAQLETALANEDVPMPADEQDDDIAVTQNEISSLEPTTVITTNTTINPDIAVTVIPASPVDAVAPKAALLTQNRHVLDYSSDEGELTLDDEMPKISTTVISTRRPVVQESDDEDEDDDNDDEGEEELELELEVPKNEVLSNAQSIVMVQLNDAGKANMGIDKETTAAPNDLEDNITHGAISKDIPGNNQRFEFTTTANGVDPKVGLVDVDPASSDEGEFEFETQPVYRPPHLQPSDETKKIPEGGPMPARGVAEELIEGNEPCPKSE